MKSNDHLQAMRIIKSQSAEIENLRQQLADKPAKQRAAEDANSRLLVERIKSLEAEVASRQANAKPAPAPAPTGPQVPNLESSAPATEDERKRLHDFLNGLPPVARAQWFQTNMRQVFARFGKPVATKPSRIIYREKGGGK